MHITDFKTLLSWKCRKENLKLTNEIGSPLTNRRECPFRWKKQYHPLGIATDRRQDSRIFRFQQCHLVIHSLIRQKKDLCLFLVLEATALQTLWIGNSNLTRLILYQKRGKWLLLMSLKVVNSCIRIRSLVDTLLFYHLYLSISFPRARGLGRKMKLRWVVMSIFRIGFSVLRVSRLTLITAIVLRPQSRSCHDLAREEDGMITDWYRLFLTDTMKYNNYMIICAI